MTAIPTSPYQYMRPETREKWRMIAEKDRRDIVEVLDMAADRELVRLGITPTEPGPARTTEGG